MWGEAGNGVTIGRTVEEFNVEEGVVSTGHAMSVCRQHDAPDGVTARTHDHHWGERTNNPRETPNTAEGRHAKPAWGAGHETG